METRADQARRGLGPGGRGGPARQWLITIPVLILVVAAGLGVATVSLGVRSDARLGAQINEEHRLRLQSCREHVQDYFDAVYSTLLFISLDNDVVALRTDARSSIQRLYDHQWEHHRLTEIYVVQQEFRGDGRPLMTFERGTDRQGMDEVHSPAREQDEYRELQRQIREFAATPTLRALLSRELHLCVPDADGARARGFVYSVPIRRGNELRGIVSGMFEHQTLREVIRREGGPQLAFLANARGEFIGDTRLPEGLRSQLAARFAAGDATPLRSSAPGTLQLGRHVALWERAALVAGEEWWLVSVHDPTTHPALARLGGFSGWWVLAASVLVTGLALALLVRTVGQRLAEQVRHLEARKELERAVQRVSEREQRRIGEQLHEDLCQRLAGIQAVTKVLEKKLSARNLPEAQVASEVARDTSESLTCAREMADALQPVPLLQHGLLAALQVLAATAQSRSGIPCRFTASDSADVSDVSVATHLYRIAQEAVENAIQHAHPRHIRIGLSVGDNHTTLTIADDGRGLAPRAGIETGLGIRIMRYRSDLIGGELELGAATGGGTLVHCSVPTPSPGASV